MIMKILVFAEHRENKIRKISSENVTLARQLGEPFDVAVVGPHIENMEEALGKFGADKVLHYKNEDLAAFSADAYAKIMAEVVKETGAEVVIMGATSTGKDLAPRMAAYLDAACATDCTEVFLENGELTVVRPMYAGKVRATVKLTSSVKIVTVRPNIYAAKEEPAEMQVEEKSVDMPGTKTVVKELVTGEKGKLDVTEADIIVSGGRGLKGPENWHMIEELAAVLGAAHGASRAAVDAGWRPHDEQVGQTGKTVSPSLYVAVGISGAIQHLAGMSSSKFIVAINKDEDAPIFKLADYGIAGDAFEVVPRLIDELKKRGD
jgi:electron transfer flavoprotein alpha subunit